MSGRKSEPEGTASSRSGRRAFFILAAMLGLCAPAMRGDAAGQADDENAAGGEDERPWNVKPAPSDPRDFSGVWMARSYLRSFRQLDGSLPPMTPAGKALREQRLALEKAGVQVKDAPTQCIPAGVPRVNMAPHPIQFVYTRGAIVMLYEVMHNVRFIHMDGKPVPPGLPRTRLGYSRGYWDGNSLVVETTNQVDGTDVDKESPSHGEQLRITERFTKVPNAKGGVDLQDVITIVDPERFTAPWSTKLTYAWRGDVTLVEYACEENNEFLPGAPAPAKSEAGR
jgi:hypothetical protein